jgi:hypothetical protein
MKICSYCTKDSKVKCRGCFCAKADMSMKHDRAKKEAKNLK